MCTFHVSGHGQGIFMSSDSEFQRLSTVKEDKLNLPACLPDLFVQTGDPGPYHGGVGKRILDALFTSGPVSVDREQLCKHSLFESHQIIQTVCLYNYSLLMGYSTIEGDKTTHPLLYLVCTDLHLLSYMYT